MVGKKDPVIADDSGISVPAGGTGIMKRGKNDWMIFLIFDALSTFMDHER